MITFVALIRGINVGGKKLLMKDLASLCTSSGFESVRTYLQSGNVVFESRGSDPAKIAEAVQKKLKSRLALDVTVLVRDAGEIGRVIAQNPFAERDPSKLHVTFLSARPTSIPKSEIHMAKDAKEEYSVLGREVYLFLPNGYGRSKLSNAFFEKVLKVSATTRNWRTVTALVEMTRKP